MFTLLLRVTVYIDTNLKFSFIAELLKFLNFRKIKASPLSCVDRLRPPLTTDTKKSTPSIFTGVLVA